MKSVDTIDVKVIPNAKKSEIAGLMDDVIKIRIHAAPEKGKANKELIRFLSKTFDIPKADIVITSGHTQNNKRIEIQNITKEEIFEKFALRR